MKKIKSINFKAIIFEIGETFAVSFLVIYVIYTFIASIEIVSGASMEPNFFTGERILVDKISPRIEPYKRGDIVVLVPPGENNRHYIKRIIGMPGDVFKVFECSVYITNGNGQFKLEEPYLSVSTCTTDGLAIKEGRSFRLGDREYVVLGDNRDASVDSRYFGVVTSKHILGRVIFRFWPLNHIGFL